MLPARGVFSSKNHRLEACATKRQPFTWVVSLDSLQTSAVGATLKRRSLCQNSWENRILNGVHDIGGMDGFGPIHREADEPVFHEPWESRVVGMLLTGAGLPPEPLDAFRHRLERLDPIKYLSSSYY